MQSFSWTPTMKNLGAPRFLVCHPKNLLGYHDPIGRDAHVPNLGSTKKKSTFFYMYSIISICSCDWQYSISENYFPISYHIPIAGDKKGTGSPTRIIRRSFGSSHTASTSSAFENGDPLVLTSWWSNLLNNKEVNTYHCIDDVDGPNAQVCKRLLKWFQHNFNPAGKENHRKPHTQIGRFVIRGRPRFDECQKIRPHRFGGEGVLIGGQQQH